jgi:cytochrome c553
MILPSLSGSACRVLALLVGLIASFVLAACAPAAEALDSQTPLPRGDVARGAALFTQSINGAPACSGCHALDATTLVGPGMEGYGARAGSRVSGMSAEQYTLDSILRPASHLVPNFSNLMYNDFASKLSAQDIADLVAFSLSL